MLRGVILSSILLVLPFLGSGSAEQDSMHYSILAPKAFRVSTVYNVTATCYNVTSTVHLTLRLESKEGVLVEGQVDLEEGVTKIVSLQIPDFVAETAYTLYADGSGGLVFNNSHVVSVTRKTLSIFVQTDKAMYKPGQTVLFRAILIRPDLKPYNGSVDVDIFDHVGNKISQWKKQKNNTGVISQKLVLSDQTPLGDWQIVVNAGGNSFTKTFQVAEYVLPKVEVTVTLPSYYLLYMQKRDVQPKLPITVTAKYTYGKPVKGRAIITTQLQTYRWRGSGDDMKKVMDVELVNGKADVKLTIEDLIAIAPNYTRYYGQTDPWQMLAHRSLLVVADVNETVTGIGYSGNATVDVKIEKYKLEFLPFSPGNFKPGLLYTAFFQLSKMDGSAPDLPDITLPGGAHREIPVLAILNHVQNHDGPNYTYVPATNKFINVTITSTGFMSCSLMIDSNVTSFNLQPSLYISDTNTTIQGGNYVSAFKTRDKQGIQVSFNSDDGMIKSDQNAVFTVRTTEPIKVFQYQILSKGNILSSGNVVGDPSTQHSFSVWISKQLATESAPSIRVLVWFITNSGEIVTDSTEVSVKDVFANKVSLSFNRESTTPSQSVDLTINAYPGSYVGLLAVDMSVLLLKSGNDITQDMVTKDLAGYDSVQDKHYGGWIDKRRKRSIWFPRFIDGTDSKSILDKAGLLLLTDGYIFAEPLQIPYYLDSEVEFMLPNGDAGVAMRGKGLPDGALAKGGDAADAGGEPSSEPRVNFPETWLWLDEITGADGKVRMEVTAPDTITSWVASGFGISPVVGLGIAEEKAQLTVFKQFFISPNLPYSVIRGEEIALQVTVFNYLPKQLDLVLTLKESTYYKVHGPASKTVQVESDDAVSVYFWIIPEALGQIPIEIVAKSAAAGDAVKVMLLVKPEGIQRQYSTSTFIQLSSSRSTYNLSLPVSLPPTGTLVPGSEYIEVTVIGDLMGPSVKGLDSLLKMPYGCGEQNMLTLAPDVYIVKYLTISNQLNDDIKSKALGFMNAGYQRELTYQRSDGSFSAFGNSDESGSVWLSAFVIDVFRQADDYIPVEDAKIAQTMQWIISNQAGNGSFAEPPLGRVIHTDMQGGSSQGLALTAYVFIALLQNQKNSLVESAKLTASIAKARQFLEDEVDSAASDPYALSIIAYALSLAHSPKVSNVLQKLEALAKVEAGTKHWEKLDEIPHPDEHRSWEPPYSQARAINIEMTSYVLRAYCQLNDTSKSLPIAKWIIGQRNANGGFSSTQDTVVALAALADFASLIIGPSGERNLEVTLATDSVKYSFSPVTDETAILLQSYQLPSDTLEVNVSATGSGAVLVQLNAIYNVYKTEDNSGIELGVTTEENGNKITITSCGSWKQNGSSGMVVMEFNPLTGFEVSNLDDLRNSVKSIKRVEKKHGNVVLYFDELTESETCVNIVSDKVFAVSKVKDASVKVYPYYDPSGGRTMLYSAPKALSVQSPCEECPQCCDKICEQETIDGVVWGRTQAGPEITRPCPRNGTGTCSRTCQRDRDKAVWSPPNCKSCVDKEFEDLLKQIESVEKTKDQKVIVKIASDLSVVTNKSEGLSPGNLNASVRLINRLADLKSDGTVNTSAAEIKSIVQAASNILQVNNSNAWKELETENKSIATSILFSLDVYGRSLSDISEHSIEMEDSLVLQAWSYQKSGRPPQIDFPNGSLWGESRGDGISISMEALNSENQASLKMWGSYYRTVDDYLPLKRNSSDKVNSRVLSFSIGGLMSNETLKQPVVITLHHNEEKRTRFQRTCSFWNFDKGDWDSTGCSVTSTNKTHTICSCDHLTNFAVLMSLKPSEDKLLSLLSIIGCSISIAALILTIIVYAVTWKQAKSAQATVLLNLCVALIIAYVIFLTGADKFDKDKYSEVGCQAVAVLLHYFFLVAFFIMLIEGVELVLYIIFVFHVRRTRETIMLIAAAWVLPLIIVGVSLGSSKLEGYGHETACWLSAEKGLIWAFVGPVLSIITINFIILIIVLRWMSQKKALLAKNAQKRDEIRATLWNLSVTCPVLGLGWLFGIFSVAFDHTAFEYLFVIANSIQGLLIFIFHALFHNKKMNEKITSFYSNYICRCRKTDLSVSTQMTSSQDQTSKGKDRKGLVPKAGKGKQGNFDSAGTQFTSFSDSETIESKH